MHDKKREQRWKRLHKERDDFEAEFQRQRARIPCLIVRCPNPRERDAGPYCSACRKRLERQAGPKRAKPAKDGEALHVETGDVPPPKRGPFPVPKVVLG